MERVTIFRKHNLMKLKCSGGGGGGRVGSNPHKLFIDIDDLSLHLATFAKNLVLINVCK